MDKRVAIITGAAKGIGFAGAKRFCEGGYVTVMVDNDASTLMAASDDLKQQGFDVEAYDCDVRSYEQCAQVVADVDKKYGRIDALYNNAGILGDRDGILGFDPDMVKDAFEVNVFGSLNMIQLVAKAMVSHGTEGSIINTTSLNAEVATWDPIGYIGSKGAMKAITQGAAFQLGAYKIRVNAVSPGCTNTPMAVASYECPAVHDECASLSMRNMWIQPWMIANTAFFLASNESYGINGAVINVEDGYSAAKSVNFAPLFAAWEQDKAERGDRANWSIINPELARSLAEWPTKQ